MGLGVLQPWHLIIVVVIVLVIFGPGKLPMLGKAVGDSVRDFKKAVTDDSSKATITELEPGTRACPNCHKPLPIADRFCGACGARSEPTAA
jgi:sec-independent protein translocase protein TatA